jgi:hypothetical protein
MKRFIFAAIMLLWSLPAMAANITMTSNGSSQAMGSTTYTVVFDLVAAEDGTGTFDSSSDDWETWASLFTHGRPGTILSVDVVMDETNTPTTLWDIYFYGTGSTLKTDLLGLTGENHAVTENFTLFATFDGQRGYKAEKTPPIPTVTGAGNGGKATFTVIVMR